MGAAIFSVIICTHNPRAEYLAKTLDSIRCQDIPYRQDQWEIVVVDNASHEPLAGRLDMSWHADARTIREDRLGLTHARLRSFHETCGEILIYIDDDNLLGENYLARAVSAFRDDPNLGAIGGKVLPRYEVDPPTWFHEVGISLACRDLGDAKMAADWRDMSPADHKYPECAPIGAGMGIRRAAYAEYVRRASADPVRLALGRRGADLASGEDNDMIMSVLAQGWTVAYLPELQLEHLIPAHRLTQAYLERYAYSSNRTWVQTLSAHGIRPWGPIAPWTAGIRKGRAFFRNRAWSGPVPRIRWRGACGLIDGRASIAPQ